MPSQLTIIRTSSVFILCTTINLCYGLSNNSKNDPYPVFTTLDPHHYLDTKRRDELKGWEKTDRRENYSLSLTPFNQTADSGKNKIGELVPLGDIDGRWYMLGLLFGELPEGQSLPETLAIARSILFPSIPPADPIDIQIIDPEHEFGYFKVHGVYKKRGLRFEFETQLLCDVGIQVQGGVADICQTATKFEDLTTNATAPTTPFPNLTKDNVQTYIMKERLNIANELALDLGSFHKFFFEDLRVNLYWRHIYQVNKNRESWPVFLFIPFASIGFSAALGKKRDYEQAFSLPFGNNGHYAFGAEGGTNIDFFETVEIGWLAGITYFLQKDCTNFPVPNSLDQSGIFPFRTNVEIKPGFNWHFGFKMHARHFIDRLSFYAQYIYLCHQDDSITLKKSDDAFKTGLFEDNSGWKTQLANIAFNYDISPQIGLGFLWQAPLSQCRSYKSTTVMLSLNLLF